ncbi:hypothetical protein LINPERHAP1_LOCUS83 [Linum perenne]
MKLMLCVMVIDSAPCGYCNKVGVLDVDW